MHQRETRINCARLWLVLAVLTVSGCACGLVGTLPNVEGMEHAQIVIIGPPALFTACSSFRWEENTQTVTTEAGKVYYFRLDPRFGGVVFINRITTETGRELVCKTLRLP